MNFFTDTLHLPWLIGFLVIVIEFFGTLNILIGLVSRVWAALLAVLTLGIVL